MYVSSCMCARVPHGNPLRFNPRKRKHTAQDSTASDPHRTAFPPTYRNPEQSRVLALLEAWAPHLSSRGKDKQWDARRLFTRAGSSKRLLSGCRVLARRPLPLLGRGKTRKQALITETPMEKTAGRSLLPRTFDKWVLFFLN